MSLVKTDFECYKLLCGMYPFPSVYKRCFIFLHIPGFPPIISAFFFFFLNPMLGNSVFDAAEYLAY